MKHILHPRSAARAYWMCRSCSSRNQALLASLLSLTFLP
jgi:hypothetical protein